MNYPDNVCGSCGASLADYDSPSQLCRPCELRHVSEVASSPDCTPEAAARLRELADKLARGLARQIAEDIRAREERLDRAAEAEAEP